MSSSMSAPALDNISRELHIPSEFQTNLILSIFLLAYSFGPFVLSPCSEIWGRKRIIQGGNLFFLLFNTACGFSRTQAQLVAFRFLAGLGGSASIGVRDTFFYMEDGLIRVNRLEAVPCLIAGTREREGKQ
jgi:MFS family permease